MPALCPLLQDLFGGMAWSNMTERSGGKIAGFVDFDWGANLCPSKTCSEDMKVPGDIGWCLGTPGGAWGHRVVPGDTGWRLGTSGVVL